MKAEQRYDIVDKSKGKQESWSSISFIQILCKIFVFFSCQKGVESMIGEHGWKKADRNGDQWTD